MQDTVHTFPQEQQTCISRAGVESRTIRAATEHKWAVDTTSTSAVRMQEGSCCCPADSGGVCPPVTAAMSWIVLDSAASRNAVDGSRITQALVAVCNWPRRPLRVG
jgi:hypothetical protein